MYLISALYKQLFFYHFLLQKQPCLRGWNHSSMSLFWNAIVLVVGQAASSCKSRYQVAKNARPCVLRDSRQSNLIYPACLRVAKNARPCVQRNSRRRNLIYPAWLRVAKNARCCVQRCVVEVQESTLIEPLLFLKCCSSSGWIWTLTKIHWWDW